MESMSSKKDELGSDCPAPSDRCFAQLADVFVFGPVGDDSEMDDMCDDLHVLPEHIAAPADRFSPLEPQSISHDSLISHVAMHPGSPASTSLQRQSSKESNSSTTLMFHQAVRAVEGQGHLMDILDELETDTSTAAGLATPAHYHSSCDGERTNNEESSTKKSPVREERSESSNTSGVPTPPQTPASATSTSTCSDLQFPDCCTRKMGSAASSAEASSPEDQSRSQTSSDTSCETATRFDVLLRQQGKQARNVAKQLARKWKLPSAAKSCVWEVKEQIRFLDGVLLFENSFKVLTLLVGSRSESQVRSHAQKAYGNWCRKMMVKLQSQNCNNSRVMFRPTCGGNSTKWGEGPLMHLTPIGYVFFVSLVRTCVLKCMDSNESANYLEQRTRCVDAFLEHGIQPYVDALGEDAFTGPEPNVSYQIDGRLELVTLEKSIELCLCACRSTTQGNSQSSRTPVDLDELPYTIVGDAFQEWVERVDVEEVAKYAPPDCVRADHSVTVAVPLKSHYVSSPRPVREARKRKAAVIEKKFCYENRSEVPQRIRAHRLKRNTSAQTLHVDRDSTDSTFSQFTENGTSSSTPQCWSSGPVLRPAPTPGWPSFHTEDTSPLLFRRAPTVCTVTSQWFNGRPQPAVHVTFPRGHAAGMQSDCDSTLSAVSTSSEPIFFTIHKG